MLRFDGIVFGPIKSRRLGNSLGINLLPGDGKLCNFDCIYCECGWNADGREHGAMPDAQSVEQALSLKLQTLSQQGEKVDSITFSGHGEPTLHPDFPAIVDATLRLRDIYCPDAVISVLSNATTLQRPDVLDALRKVDNPIMKVDAPTNAMVEEINRPNGRYDVAQVVEDLSQFHGNFILQTMFLKGASWDFEKDSATLEAWKDIVRKLHPRKVMVYSLDREAPQKGLSRMDASTMHALTSDLLDEGFDIQINN